MTTQAKAYDIHDGLPKDKLPMQWNKDLPSGQADMTPKNNTSMINVLGVAMLLNTLNASALGGVLEAFIFNKQDVWRHT